MFSFKINCSVVIIQIYETLAAAVSASGADRHSDNRAILIGSILLTDTSRILVYDIKGKMIVNETFPHIEQLPLKSAVHQTARMLVTEKAAYIGGYDGIIFIVTLSTELIESVSAMGGGESVSSAEVTVTNTTLPFSCIPEVFTLTAEGLITACFSHSDSILYIVNVHEPWYKSELLFTANSDLSNILPVGDVFYFVQHGHLFRADVPRGQTQVAVLENCQSAWLDMNQYHYIIIQCTDRSYLHVPKEWNTDAPGIKDGAWKHRNIVLRPCHGDGFASVVFSVDGTTLTIYDVRNDFWKGNITLTGTPDASTLTCTWSNDHLTFLYEDLSCRCWRQYQLTEQYINETSSIIPYSEGMLPPLVTGNSRVNQDVLLFHPTYLLVPSTHQLFVDLNNNVTHPMITDDVVIYHAGIYSIRDIETGDPKNTSDDGAEDTSTSVHWAVYLAVAVAIVIIMVFVITGLVAYRKRYRILFIAW